MGGGPGAMACLPGRGKGQCLKDLGLVPMTPQTGDCARAIWKFLLAFALRLTFGACSEHKVAKLAQFARMLDKIRLHAAGKLPPAWQDARGLAYATSFDSRCCRFLHIDYAPLEKETLKGGTDQELLEWAFVHGGKPTDEEIEIWNAFMTKRGWRDAGTQRLNERLAEIGLPPGTVQTMFEFIDLDEGRRQAGPR